jgi:hypothetical protein
MKDWNGAINRTGWRLFVIRTIYASTQQADSRHPVLTLR